MTSNELISLELDCAKAFGPRVIQQIQLFADPAKREKTRLVLDEFFSSCFTSTARLRKQESDRIPALGWLYQELQAAKNPKWSNVAHMMTLLGELSEMYEQFNRQCEVHIPAGKAPADTSGQEYRDWVESKNDERAFERYAANTTAQLHKKALELASVWK